MIVRAAENVETSLDAVRNVRREAARCEHRITIEAGRIVG